MSSTMTTTTHVEPVELSILSTSQPAGSKSGKSVRSAEQSRTSLGGKNNDLELIVRRSHDSDRRSNNEVSDGTNGTLPSPTTATEVAERWNKSKGNVARVLACFWAFIVMGANDAALGPLIPYLQSYYNLSYAVVSLVFLSPIFGYSASALLNDAIHYRFGRRGIAFLAPLCHLIAYTVAALHPPFPVIVVIYVLSGFGNGMVDAAYNAWIGNMANANEILGFLHGFYGLGATIAPLVATALVVTAGTPWWYFYYVMLGLAGIELATSLPLFWHSTAAHFRAAHPRTTDEQGHRMKEAVLRKPAARITWTITVFATLYMGIEVGLGGWITEFMLEVRHASPFASGMSATGFWLGMTVGRVVLGFITPRIGENRAIMIYLPLTMALELIFWLVPQFYVSVVAVSLQGFFLGPLFPAAIVAATKLLPRHLHVTAIGFMAAVGGGGAAAFPFAVGAIAQAKGVQVLQPFVLVLMAVCFLVWLSLPSMRRKTE